MAIAEKSLDCFKILDGIRESKAFCQKRLSRRTWLTLLATGASVLATVAGSGATTLIETQGIVRHVDHILISSPRASDLFRLLTERFQLPVAWPMSDYGNFASGGVAVGEVNLEISQGSVASANSGRQARLRGFALEPEQLKEALSRLEARSLTHGKPAPFRKTEWYGISKTLWTTVALPSVSNDDLEIFLCEYGFDVAERRSRLQTELKSRRGGPLGIAGIRELVVGSPRIDTARTSWKKLLAPAEPDAEGRWKLRGGPLIRLEPSSADALTGLILEIHSVEQARNFLRDHSIPYTERDGGLLLQDPLVSGLNIVLKVKVSGDRSSPP